MAATPYRKVTIQENMVLTRRVMDQFVSNIQWIFDNSPRGKFYASSDGARPRLVPVLVAGRRKIKRDRKSGAGRAVVRFGNHDFHPACHPQITTAVISDNEKKIFCVVNGLSTVNRPDANGFEIITWSEENMKGKDIWVSYHAFGFKEIANG